eukprot:Nitzschia sp. Nitz4//scaffold81_size91200//59768//61012//NITZ4_004991-RA/size91200-snap-gene-0.24-mRNA-1//1//CDS//3329558725//9286//frame0
MSVVSPISTTREGRTTFLQNVRSVGDSAKALRQVSTRQATIALCEREMKTRKEKFGLDLYVVMERYRSMGKNGGGEVDPEVVQVFTDCVRDISLLLKKRKHLQAELLKKSKPSALCYQQTTGDSTDSGDATISNTKRTTRSWMPGFRLQQAKEAMEKSQTTSRIKADLAGLDKDIAERQKRFGVEMFEVMAYLVDNYEPKDEETRTLLESTKRDIAAPLARMIKAEKEIHDVQTSGSILVSHRELHDFFSQTPKTWAMLQVNIGISEEECKMVAFRVGLELTSGLHGKQSMEATITQGQFERFKKQYVDDPKGSQEFFHRSVFAAFDEDHDGILNKKETNAFLDTFYVTGSIFQGDDRLPEKHKLNELILSELDENGDGEFSFEEIRSLIGGSAQRMLPEAAQL